MAAKGTIKDDPILVNKYRLKVLGMPDFTFTKISGIEEELETVTLPDRTVVSGGHTKATEFDAELPLHHSVEVAAMELWLRGCKDPVDPGYKKAATLVQESSSGKILRTYALEGVFPKKRGTSDLEMENEGDMAVLALSFSVDSIDPV